LICIKNEMLLPSRHVAHVGQLMGDAFVAVDAGLEAGKEEPLVRIDGARALPRHIEGAGAAAVAPEIRGNPRHAEASFTDTESTEYPVVTIDPYQNGPTRSDHK
jgi:hypothetical protein